MIVEQLEHRDGDLPGPLLTELAALYATDDAFQELSGDFTGPGAPRPEQVATSLAGELAHPGAEVLLARSAGRLVAVAVTRTGPRQRTPGQAQGHPQGYVRGHAPEAGTGAGTGEGIRAGTGAGAGRALESEPWIGLLMVHGELRRAGYGRELAGIVEARLREAGHTGVRLAVPEDNTGALAFWTALGYEEIARGTGHGGIAGHSGTARPPGTDASPAAEEPPGADGPPGRPCAVLRKDLSAAGAAAGGA